MADFQTGGIYSVQKVLNLVFDDTANTIAVTSTGITAVKNRLEHKYSESEILSRCFDTTNLVLRTA